MSPCMSLPKNNDPEVVSNKIDAYALPLSHTVESAPCRHLVPASAFAIDQACAVRCPGCGARVTLPLGPTGVRSCVPAGALGSRPGLKYAFASTHRPEWEVGP